MWIRCGRQGVFLSSWVVHIKSVGLVDKHADMTPTGPKPLDLEQDPLGDIMGLRVAGISCGPHPRDSVCGPCGWTRVVSLWVGYDY